MYFFLTSLLQEVESRLKVLADLKELVSAESLESFVLNYTIIQQHQPDCPVLQIY
jgi:exocyst complex component 3